MDATLLQPAPSVTRRAPTVTFHTSLLALSFAVVVLSCVLRIAGERQVLIPFTDIPLPGVCTYQRLFGVDCPGCGLTRSFISIGHGNLANAWRFNPAGIFGFVLVASQIPYRITQLFRVRNGKTALRLGWLGWLVFAAFMGIMIAQWILRTLLYLH